jgi:hypothetical protein
MGISFTTYSAGTVIARSALDTDLDAARTYLNGGVVVGDVDAASIERVHIYRPDTQGFPTESTEGQSQSGWDRGRARSSMATQPGSVADNGRLWIARLRERRSIFLNYLLDDESWPIADMACRFYLPSKSLIEISAQWEAITQAFDGTLTADVFPTNAGRFRIRYKEVGEAVSTTATLAGTDRINPHSYAEQSAFTGSMIMTEYNLFTSGGQVELAAGLWDAWLEYDLNGADVSTILNPKQVILGVGSFVVEAYHEQS